MIKIKSSQDIRAMRMAGSLSKLALRKAGEHVVPGATTHAINKLVEGIIRMHAGMPAFFGLRWFSCFNLCFY